MKVPCQLASRNSIRAFYSDGIVLILATGSASAGDRIDIDMVLPATTPLEFCLLRCPLPGIWPDVMRGYTYTETFLLTRHPEQVRLAGTIRVRHQDGVDDVRLEPLPEEMQELQRTTQSRGASRSATGYSSSLSFDEAFAEAVKILGADGEPHPDALLRVRVEEIGGLFGGFAGFHQLYVRVVAGPRVPGGIVEIAPDLPGGPIQEVAPDRRLVGGPGDVIVEVAPGRPYRPDPEIIVEVAPPTDKVRSVAEVIVEIAPPTEGAPAYGGSEVIVEVAPPTEGAPAYGGGTSEVIVEVAPPTEGAPAYGGGGSEVIVEVAPPTEGAPAYGGGGTSEVIVEVAPPPDKGRPVTEVIVEVAPPPTEGAPPEKPGPEVIVEVAPDRPDEARRHGPIVEVAPDRPDQA